MQSPPLWLPAQRETELTAIASRLADAIHAAGKAAALVVADVARRLDTSWRGYEGRRVRRTLRALGLLAPPPAPIRRYNGHGRLRSRRELRDIRRMMRRRPCVELGRVSGADV